MDHSAEILENPQFARFMELQAELQSMGYFCISMWSTSDILEEFRSSFEEDYDELTEVEVDLVKDILTAIFDKGGSIENENVFNAIQEILNKR